MSLVELFKWPDIQVVPCGGWIFTYWIMFKWHTSMSVFCCLRCRQLLQLTWRRWWAFLFLWITLCLHNFHITFINWIFLLFSSYILLASNRFSVRNTSTCMMHNYGGCCRLCSNISRFVRVLHSIRIHRGVNASSSCAFNFCDSGRAPQLLQERPHARRTAARPTSDAWFVFRFHDPVNINHSLIYIPFVRQSRVRGFDYFLTDIPLLISWHMVCKQKWDKRKSLWKEIETSHSGSTHKRYSKLKSKVRVSSHY